jgi:hypothetical protein
MGLWSSFPYELFLCIVSRVRYTFEHLTLSRQVIHRCPTPFCYRLFTYANFLAFFDFNIQALPPLNNFPPILIQMLA